MCILNAGADFVLGRKHYSCWADYKKALPVVKGEEIPLEEKDVWEWIRNPLPPASDNTLFASLRLQLGIPEQVFYSGQGFGSLGFLEQQTIGQSLESGFLRDNNPIVRHTVLRRRQTLEDAGLLEKIGVNIHPNPVMPASVYAGVGFPGLGLLTNLPFDLAYKAADSFTIALQKRTKAAGFMKTMLLQRICSSFAYGRSTAEHMLRREILEEEDQPFVILEATDSLTLEEATHLRTIVEELSRPEARDPKISAAKHFLNHHRSEGKTWLEQRLGRIKRFGQARRNVDMLNFVYHLLSARQLMKARYCKSNRNLAIAVLALTRQIGFVQFDLTLHVKKFSLPLYAPLNERKGSGKRKGRT